MTNPPAGDRPVIDVRVADVADGVQLGPPPAPARGRRKRITTRAFTVVLTAATPVDTILPADPARLYALVQAGGADVVINNNKGEAQNVANQAAGLPAPIGMVLPYGNTVPTKIPGGDRWWAAAAVYPAQITVLVVQEADT